MIDDRLSGLALIAGSCGTIITMALHPTGHVSSAEIEPMLHKLIAVHALAIACVPVLFLGGLGLRKRIGPQSQAALSGIVFYTVALVAVMNAAVADGLVTPRILRQIVASAGSQPTVDGWRMISHYNFYVNQGYAEVYVVASSVAIFLWSLAAWRSKSLAGGLAIYGFILGPLAVIGLLSGHLNLDTHGFGAVIFGQAAWFITAGVLLGREYRAHAQP